MMMFRPLLRRGLRVCPRSGPGSRLLSSSSSHPEPQTPITWPRLLALSGASFFALGYYLREKELARERVVAKNTQVVGKALLGGPWTLVDSEGTRVTHLDVLGGRFGLLYFGFTHCPDICPTEMTKMSEVVDELDKRDKGAKDRILPVFISVDAKRDTPQVVGKYAKQYHSKMVGLTGTPEDIQKVCKTFRVYHNPTSDTDSSEDYLIDHSIVIYLVAPSGEFLDFYTQMSEVSEVVERVEKQVKGYVPTPSPSSPSPSVAT